MQPNFVIYLTAARSYVRRIFLSREEAEEHGQGMGLPYRVKSCPLGFNPALTTPGVFACGSRATC